MDDWLSRYAAALGAGTGLGDDGEGAVLDLARRVAHATQRRDAPLASFLTGCYVGLRVAEGADASAALDEALRVAGGLLPPEAD